MTHAHCGIVFHYGVQVPSECSGIQAGICNRQTGMMGRPFLTLYDNTVHPSLYCCGYR